MLTLQRVGGRSLDLSSEACARLLNQVPSVPVASSVAAAMYPIPAEVPPQASRQQHSPPAICSLPAAQMLGQPQPEMASWLGLQDPMPSHEPIMVHDTHMASHLVAPFTATAAPHTGYGQVAHEFWQMPQGRAQQPQGYQGLFLGGQQPLQRREEVSPGFRRSLQGSEQVLQGHEQQGCRELPQGGELMPQGLSEDWVIPGRLTYAQMHSQSCSRVHPRGFDRTPSFTEEQRTIQFSNIPKLLLQTCYSTLMS